MGSTLLELGTEEGKLIFLPSPFREALVKETAKGQRTQV